MDLNEAMVNLYKQRSSAANKQRSQANGSGSSNNNKPSQPTRAKPTSVDLTNHHRDAKNADTSTVDIATVLADCPRSTVIFEQLHGCESAREQILDIVSDFQDQEEEEDGQDEERWPFLICGSSGLGKTSLVEAAANHANLPLIRIPVATMQKKLRTPNKFEENLEHLIRHCLASQPAIVLIDDLDIIMEERDYRLIISYAIIRLLAQKLLVFCTASSASSELGDIRFLQTIQLKRPSLDARSKILTSLCGRKKVFKSFTDEDIQTLAVNTPSFTALNLKMMLRLSKIKSKRSACSLKHCEEAIEIVKQSFVSGTHLIVERPSVTWADIGGMSRVKETFSSILKQTRSDNGDYQSVGIALYGPPGCGKTMVAQAMANEAGFNYMPIKAAELVNKFLGETEKNIRRVFGEAKEYEPCIIFFDEFDGLCGNRSSKDSVTSAIQTLLSEMDGFTKRGRVMVLVSTNRLDDIDPAMKRPGRLSKHIYVGPPDEEARRDILSVILKKQQRDGVSLGDDVDLDYWAKRTDKFTGAELRELFDEALNRARDDSTCVDNNVDKIILRLENFEQAMKEFLESNQELDKKIRSDNNCDEVRDKLQKRLKFN